MSRLGRIPVTVNGVSVSRMGVKNVSVSRKQAQKIHMFADGSRDRSEGQPEYTFSFQCALDADKQILLAAIEDAKATGEVNVGYTLGNDEYLLVNCGFDTEDVSSDSNGTGDLTISGVAPDRLKVR
jgi:hypothetical protein